jgi:signal transduction histidine kinase
MSQPSEGRQRAAQSVPEAIVRTLRHELGDLLQTVYASVAILKERLPSEMELERRILADMRNRAESCLELLDTVHDLVAPVALEVEPIDLAELAEGLVSRAATRYPQVEVRLEKADVPPVRADQRRLAQVGSALVANACATGSRRVTCRLRPGPSAGEVTWSFLDDGVGVAADRLGQVFSPLNTAPHGHLGPGLAMAQRLVQMQGGRVTAGNRPEGGFRVDVVLPAAAQGEPGA